ncbi:MAG: HAMP domain-containing histidine kinase [Clostridiales bacterium]|nr:HAMP domain-containing histidine kinase [Clostridiales bacterium]
MKLKQSLEEREDITYRESKRTIRNAFIIGAIIIVTLVSVITLMLDRLYLEYAVDELGATSWIVAIIVIAMTGIISGAALSYLAGSIYLKPINDIIDGMGKLAEGKFDTRLSYKGPGDIESIYRGFNALAKQLQNVEILRSDFINNFSHEFKTPIMSINGFISLLKSKDLPRDKQIEYLNIIEEETQRLAMITTNILNLTKYESQEIITDKTRYNVSEQIRMCVLLLERKWTQKKLKLSMDIDDTVLEANEDMMRQVWINLLDNAIKFAYDDGELAIDVITRDGKIIVKVADTGPDIPEEYREKIFGKFYQIDESHSMSGNGIGLSIVKRIVDLHDGGVSVGREDDKTVFTVELPA